MSQLSDFRFHHMCKKQNFTHLIIANGLMIFCKGNEASIRRVKGAIQHFMDTTGQVANIEKSNIFFANVDNATKEKLLKLTGFVECVLPMRYLELLLSPEEVE